MEKLIKYRKQIIVTIVVMIVIIVSLGIYILHQSLNNINYSKSEAHVVALNQFPGTIISSQIEYENMQIYYDIEIENQAHERIEVIINARSGKIIGYEYKRGDKDGDINN